MSNNSRAIDKAEKNPLLTVADLRKVTDAQFNRPGKVQETIKEEPEPDKMTEVDAIDAAINPRLTKEVRAAVAEITHIPPATFSAISLWSCFTPTLISQAPELLGQLAELQRGYDDAMALALSYTAREATFAYREYRLQSEKTALETGGVSHCEGKTRDQFEVEFRHKFESAMAVTKTFAPRARGLALPYIQKYAQMVRDLADGKAEKERSEYAFMGLPWKVSPLIATLYRAAEMVIEDSGAGHDPKSVAKFFDFGKEPNETIIFGNTTADL